MKFSKSEKFDTVRLASSYSKIRHFEIG